MRKPPLRLPIKLANARATVTATATVTAAATDTATATDTPSGQITVKSPHTFTPFVSAVASQGEPEVTLSPAIVEMTASFDEVVHCVAAEPHATFLRVAVTDRGYE
eukprot:6330675-Prymnesium_polylepis.1